jgi:hypothetical protein
MCSALAAQLYNKDYRRSMCRDGNGAVSGWSSADFKSNGFGFDSPQWFSGSGTRNLSGSVSDFGFHPRMPNGGPK